MVSGWNAKLEVIWLNNGPTLIITNCFRAWKKSGRDVGNKNQLGDVILKGLSALNIPASVITVEIIDMECESYGKYTPNR